MSGPAPRPSGALQKRERGQISTLQVTMMLMAVIVSFTVAFVPNLVIQIARTDGWLTFLVVWVADLVLAAIYAHMGLRFPGETMVESASSSLGRWLGRPLGFLFPLFFLFVSAMLLGGLSNMIATIFLPGTPVTAIAAIAMLVTAYGARSGLEVVARSSEVLVPIFLAILVGVILLDLRFAQPAYLKPVLEYGPWPALQAVPVTLSAVAVCVVMGMFQAYENEPHRAWFAKLGALSVGLLVTAALILVAVCVLGPEAAGNAWHPDLSLARMVTAGEFVERMEAVWVVTSVGASILAMAVLLWTVALGIAQTFGLREYQPLVFPLAGLVLPLSLIFFANQADQAAFTRTIFPFFALTIQAGAEVLVWLVAVVRGKRGHGQSPGRVKEPERPIG